MINELWWLWLIGFLPSWNEYLGTQGRRRWAIPLVVWTSWWNCKCLQTSSVHPACWNELLGLQRRSDRLVHLLLLRQLLGVDLLLTWSKISLILLVIISLIFLVVFDRLATWVRWLLKTSTSLVPRRLVVAVLVCLTYRFWVKQCFVSLLWIQIVRLGRSRWKDITFRGLFIFFSFYLDCNLNFTVSSNVLQPFRGVVGQLLCICFWSCLISVSAIEIEPLSSLAICLRWSIICLKHFLIESFNISHHLGFWIGNTLPDLVNVL